MSFKEMYEVYFSAMFITFCAAFFINFFSYGISKIIEVIKSFFN